MLHTQRVQRQQRAKRKRRIVKNATVDVDDVSVEPGEGNINWINISKQKLMKRELISLHKRQEALDQVIFEAIREFVSDNQGTFKFNECVNIYKDDIRQKILSPRSNIMYFCARSVDRIFRKWKGYKPKRELDSREVLFRDYFSECRRWFDVKKMDTMSAAFWIPTMEILREFSMKTAARFTTEEGVQKAFRDYFNILLLQSMFAATIKHSNTRSMWLVPAMTYRIFVRQYNHHLDVEVLVNSSKNKEIRREYVNCINIRQNALREVFYSALKQ